MAGALIAERIGIARRYVRAVDLARDYTDPDALDGYILTPSANDALQRVVRALAPTSTQRAFRVTGPYGSGKSSFAVLLAQLFSEGDLSEPAATKVAGSVSGPVPSFEPVVLVGRRTSFADELLRTLRGACSPGAPLEHEHFQEAANALLLARESGDRDIRPALELLSSLAAHLRSERRRGILLLIDEMGRFVEYAAANPSTEDPSVFQQLAELASGPGDRLAVIGLLHNRFDDYVVGLGDWMESEWNRSAERYEEITFYEPTEQSLFLLSEALAPKKPHTHGVTRSAERVFAEAGARGFFRIPATILRDVAKTLYPLHPVTIACLTAVSRRIGQHERSVFSFLQSYEPAGLQRYIGEAHYSADEWYRIDKLYDYLAAHSDIRFRSPDRERRWHLALDALALAASFDEATRSILKALALIGILEPVPGLQANSECLSWSLDLKQQDVEERLQELADQRLVHKWTARDEYSLWSNSSVDLEAWFEKAKRAVDPLRRISGFQLSGQCARNLVAHRHYHETGHLRTFGIVTSEDEGPRTNSDGWIRIVPVHPDEDLQTSVDAARSASKEAGPLCLYSLRRVRPVDLAVAYDLTLWQWVSDECEELRIDSLAKGEVDRRMLAARSSLEESFSPTSQAYWSPNGTWVQNGEVVEVGSKRDLSRRLSDACDQAFKSAPRLRNELINRPTVNRHCRSSNPTTRANARESF